MKSYIFIQAVQAEPYTIDEKVADARNPLRGRHGFRVAHANGSVGWMPEADFKASYVEVPEIDAQDILGALRDDLAQLLKGPTASENDEVDPECRRLEALRIACSSHMYDTTDGALVARARAFEEFLMGATVTSEADTLAASSLRERLRAVPMSGDDIDGDGGKSLQEIYAAANGQQAKPKPADFDDGPTAA